MNSKHIKLIAISTLSVFLIGCSAHGHHRHSSHHRHSHHHSNVHVHGHVSGKPAAVLGLVAVGAMITSALHHKSEHHKSEHHTPKETSTTRKNHYLIGEDNQCYWISYNQMGEEVRTRASQRHCENN